MGTENISRQLCSEGQRPRLPELGRHFRLESEPVKSAPDSGVSSQYSVIATILKSPNYLKALSSRLTMGTKILKVSNFLGY